MNFLNNIKCKVSWSKERADEKDTNNGKEYGIYIFDCLFKDFEPEDGYGVHSVIKTFWFKTENSRDKKFNKFLTF
tara:strand:+ start:237 stop:461 length:225 start_codon:yes stop_codon:yes gene_type:complete